PPDVIGQLLRPTIDLPFAFDFECLWIHDQRPPRSIAAWRAERADVDAVRSAVNRVGSGITGTFSQHLRLDHLHNFRILRVGFGVEDMNPRGVDPRNDQVAALHVRMRRIRTQTGTARVPSKVMQLVPWFGHVYAADEFAVAL